jgi:hypothetical protein
MNAGRASGIARDNPTEEGRLPVTGSVTPWEWTWVTI